LQDPDAEMSLLFWVIPISFWTTSCDVKGSRYFDPQKQDHLGFLFPKMIYVPRNFPNIAGSHNNHHKSYINQFNKIYI